MREALAAATGMFIATITIFVILVWHLAAYSHLTPPF